MICMIIHQHIWSPVMKRLRDSSSDAWHQLFPATASNVAFGSFGAWF